MKAGSWLTVQILEDKTAILKNLKKNYTGWFHVTCTLLYIFTELLDF